MKKLLIAIIILVILAAGSITAVLIVQNKENKKNEEAASLIADYALLSFDADSINTVTFDCKDGVYTAELIDGTWQLSGSDEFIIRNSYVQGVCTYLSELTAMKDYGEATEESKKMYGISEPTTITASDGTNKYTLYVGNVDPTGSYYYVMTDEKSKIYAIDAAIGSDLKTSRLMLKDRYLLPFPESEIAQIQLLKDGEIIYDLTYDSDNSIWNLPDEYSSFTIDQTKVTSMIAYMTRAEAQEMFDENLEDYSKYGFDMPFAELSVTSTDGSEAKLLFSYYGNNTNTYTHVLYENYGQVAAFYTGDVDFIEYTTETFLVHDICNISVYDITGFDFSYDGSDASFSVDMENSNVEMNGESITEIASDFTNFYNSISYLEFSELDFSADPDNTDPLLSVTFHFPEKNDLLLELYKADDESCYVFIDGSYTGAIADMDDINGKDSISQFYNTITDKISKS